MSFYYNYRSIRQSNIYLLHHTQTWHQQIVKWPCQSCLSLSNLKCAANKGNSTILFFFNNLLIDVYTSFQYRFIIEDQYKTSVTPSFFTLASTSFHMWLMTNLAKNFPSTPSWFKRKHNSLWQSTHGAWTFRFIHSCQ